MYNVSININKKIVDTLKCFTCKEMKELNPDNFYRSSSKRFGFQEECKECKKKRDKKLRSTSEVHARYIKSPAFVFRQLQYQAKKRDIKFELTLEYYLENLVNKPCYLCGQDNAKHWIDRINNDHSIGYTTRNTAPCCEYCNKMKLHWEKPQFINHCKIVAQFNS